MIAIIGGTGLNTLQSLRIEESIEVTTDCGSPSAPLQRGFLADQPILFLARHGQPHHIPPHKINYRANILALKSMGVRSVIAVNAVGGIHDHLAPGKFAVPDQVIDYTYGREHTLFDGMIAPLEHIDFTEPYTQVLRQNVIDACNKCGIDVLPGGTYAATQGPRLESAAEVMRIKQDGGDMIGMTGMPEASLAREAGLNYACLALSVNWAAGLWSLNPISTSQMHAAMTKGMKKVNDILEAFFSA